MRIFALDAAGGGCAVCLWHDGVVLAAQSQRMERGQAESLMPMIASVMTGYEWSSIDRFAVTVGPGSFTGVRLGLSAARGLGLANNKPVIGITTPEAYVAMAGSFGQGSVLVVAVESRRAEVYAQAFHAGKATGEIALLLPQDVMPHLGLTDGAVIGLTGDATARLKALPHWQGATLLESAGAIDPAAVAALAARRPTPITPPRALYVRPPDAVPAKARLRD